MYEPRNQRPLSRPQFLRRLGKHIGVAGLIAIVSLGLGMAGYALFEGLGWSDAFVNAAMLLGGMGPVKTDMTAAGKIFAGVYALYSGLIFLVLAGIILAPIAHRLLHHFHWEEDTSGRGDSTEHRRSRSNRKRDCGST